MSSAEIEVEGFPAEVTCKRAFRRVMFKISWHRKGAYMKRSLLSLEQKFPNFLIFFMMPLGQTNI